MSIEITGNPGTPDFGDPANFNTEAQAFFNWLMQETAGGFIYQLENIDPADYFSVQSSLTDTTADRLMKVGALGWATNSPERLIASNALDNITVTSLTRVQTAEVATVNGPSGASSGVVLTKFYNENAVFQEYSEVAGAGRKWKRIKNTTWGDWHQIYEQLSIVGTVSQSGGTPTGAVFEKPVSTANGWVRKTADGFMECWHVLTSSAGGAQTWTLPGTFFGTASTDIFFGGTIVGASTDLQGVKFSSRSTTSVDFTVVDGSGRVAETVILYAAGRWSALT